MDVVYNHTGLTENSYFERIAPGQYYRKWEDGKFADASACGNETASERKMVRKYIIESLSYWTKEFHIDGFRFDLMGIHDIETMNQAAKEIRKINPSALLYGEGWTAGDSPLPENKRALKKHSSQLDKIAVFSDDIRDGIKGHVFTHDAKGFIAGIDTLKESIKFGVTAANYHPQINIDKVLYTDKFYSSSPESTVTYTSCHDNHTLWDRINNSMPDLSYDEKIDLQKLALGIVLTSQGISFLHAGSEMGRSKNGVENSFESADEINLIDWDLLEKNKELTEYVKGLISLRKSNKLFRFKDPKDIKSRLKFTDHSSPNIIQYTLSADDNSKDLHIVYNGGFTKQIIELPAGDWRTIVDKNNVVLLKEKTVSTRTEIPKSSMLVLEKL